MELRMRFRKGRRSIEIHVGFALIYQLLGRVEGIGILLCPPLRSLPLLATVEENIST